MKKVFNKILVGVALTCALIGIVYPLQVRALATSECEIISHSESIVRSTN